MAGSIFLSYRKDDSAAWAGRLHERLLRDFVRDQIFMDIDSIEPGLDFVSILDEQVARCEVFLTIIGPNWASVKSEKGSRRLDEANDFVRIELESALKRGVRVIPVLVGGATMPRADELPESIRAIARRQAMELTHNRFNAEAGELSQLLVKLIGPLRGTPDRIEHQTRSGHGADATIEEWSAAFEYRDARNFSIFVAKSGIKHHVEYEFSRLGRDKLLIDGSRHTMPLFFSSTAKHVFTLGTSGDRFLLVVEFGGAFGRISKISLAVGGRMILETK